MRTRRQVISRLGCGLVAAALTAGVAGRPARSAQPALPVSPLTIETARGRFQFTVELAETPPAWQQGLMKRQSLPADRGMLFNYHEPRLASMWMKDTLIPLDMIFIDSRGFVVQIAADTQPLSLQTISSTVPVLAVLELNAGAAAQIGLRPGDRVVHAIFAR